MPLDYAQLVGQTFRDKEKITNRVARYLMKAADTGDYVVRGQSGIHPSEASHNPWCARSSYYRLIGTPTDPVPRALAMEVVYTIGEDSGRKWQNWIWEMGDLRGNWRCLSCRLIWYDESPYECPRCEVGKDLIRYAEVPVSNAEHLLVGSADGDVRFETGWKLIENKTIGAGTVRVEAPKLFEEFGTDYYRLWQAIRNPFPSHLRQGMLYCFCAGRNEIVYIYEPKFLTAFPKEFEIKFNSDLISDVLEKCKVVRAGLEADRPPKRPFGWDASCTTCKACPYRSTCWQTRAKQTT